METVAHIIRAGDWKRLRRLLSACASFAPAKLAWDRRRCSEGGEQHAARQEMESKLALAEAAFRSEGVCGQSVWLAASGVHEVDDAVDRVDDGDVVDDGDELHSCLFKMEHLPYTSFDPT